jgi:hypothetical protein
MLAAMSVRIGRRGGRWIEVAARHSEGEREAERFDDVAHALRFLRDGIGPGDVRALRGLLAHETAIARLDDPAVLRVVAGRLLARTFTAVVGLERGPGFVAERVEGVLSRVVLPAPAPRASSIVEDAGEVARERPESWEPVAQAQTLVAAARAGTPFCEICEAPGSSAGRIEVAAVAPAEGLDPAAQAATLIDAARSGVPFCELCRADRA